jgi:hypothetical protein
MRNQLVEPGRFVPDGDGATVDRLTKEGFQFSGSST